MRRVSQRQIVQVDENGVQTNNSPRGDCYQACIASVFELPLDQVPGRGGASQPIWDWLALNYPGVGMVVRDWLEPRDVRHDGFWIATVVSTRFRERDCGHCSPEIEVSSDFFWRRDQCPYCDGSGHATGLHAIVMEYGRRVWDPHPSADWDNEPQIVGETYFVVSDPSKLIARVVPQRVVLEQMRDA